MSSPRPKKVGDTPVRDDPVQQPTAVTFTLNIPGLPVAQPRARSARIGSHTRTYTPSKTPGGNSNGVAEFKALIGLVASQEWHGPPLTGPVRIDCRWLFPRQSAKVWKNKPMHRYPHTTKPDRDNLDKMVLDALRRAGILADDAIVYSGTLEKWHVAGDELPRTEITITGGTES